MGVKLGVQTGYRESLNNCRPDFSPVLAALISVGYVGLKPNLQVKLTLIRGSIDKHIIKFRS